ncbi:MAG: spermidine/putrescine ABC transporter ATP-binding protein [Lachnospirales bacterium]
MNLIEIKKLAKSYGDETILNNISFYIKKNEFVTFLGPSGCGKTTTLRILGGFETPTSGEVLFEGKDLTVIPPYKRKINTVFQKYALFPNMNVYNNVAYGLKIKKLDKNTIDTKVKEILKLVNLSGYEKRTIDSLSGGQQQRIAIARALVNEPEVLLLDEPLGALDLKLRKDMQIELKNIQQKLGITFIYVTHDQEEALTMSDTIVVLYNGEIQQIGSPVDIYNEPKNSFVADFIGESNIVDGKMIKDKLVTFSGKEFICVDSGFGENNNVKVVIRPEDIVISKTNGQLQGKVIDAIFKGVHYEMYVETEDETYMVHSTIQSEVDDIVYLNIEPDAIHIMED